MIQYMWIGVIIKSNIMRKEVASEISGPLYSEV